MLKSLLKKKHIESTWATAPPEIRPTLKQQHTQLTRNLESRLVSNTTIIPPLQVLTKTGTGKVKKPTEIKFGSKRKFVVINN